LDFQTKAREFLFRVFDVWEEITSLLIAGWLLIYTNFIAPGYQDNISLLIGGILSIVGLIALSNLRDRLIRLRRIQSAVEETQQKIQDVKQMIRDRTQSIRTGPDEFFTIRDESYGNFLSTSSSIDISGITLTGTIHTHSAALGKRLEMGSHIRIIILDPDAEDALSQLVLRSWSNVANLQYYKDTLRHTSELIDNIGNRPQAKGSLEVGFSPLLPAFGITILERELIDSLAFVEIYDHFTNTSPGFVIDAAKAPHTFKRYQEQFNMMWKLSKTRKIV
jgi:hypothetical protein